MRSDLCVWLDFIHKYNGSLNFMNANWLSNDQLHLYTDSAGNHQLGCGVYFNGQWAYFEWPACWKDLRYNFFRISAIVLAVFFFVFFYIYILKFIYMHTQIYMYMEKEKK